MMPFKSFERIASSDDSTIAARYAWAAPGTLALMLKSDMQRPVPAIKLKPGRRSCRFETIYRSRAEYTRVDKLRRAELMCMFADIASSRGAPDALLCEPVLQRLGDVIAGHVAGTREIGYGS